jgi:putative flippase GtrA
MIRRELAIFLIVGTLTVIIDFLTYRGLSWAQLLDMNSAKGLGFLTGTLFAYFANRFWTFGHKAHAAGSVWRFIIVYSFTLAANVLVNAFLIAWLPNNVPALLNMLMAASKFISTYNPIYHEINIILSKIMSKEAGIQIAFSVATVTSAILNFIGMKLFVFKTTLVRK